MNGSNALIKQLGDYLGLPLKFEENKPCLLMFDEKLMVAIKNNEDHWQFHCMLTEVDADTPAEVFKSYLMMNQELSNKCLGSICLDEDSQALVYIASLSLPASFESLTDFLEEVVNQYEALHQKIKSDSASFQRKQNTPQYALA